ncbi:MAG: P1 family peptidase [Lachnospiraceae bacterium]|nr:P1 family peptidase [Lachnospiraceae bacterium]
MDKKRIRDYGIVIGHGTPGPLNKITDVPGVLVGHETIVTDHNCTGVTVIVPPPKNVFRNKLTAASFVLNGFGKSLGLVQVDELGTLETPIALTNTLNVGLVHDALVDYTVKVCREDGTPVRSLNPVVCECNDGELNLICDRAVTKEHVYRAFEQACRDFAEGDVGAGKGMVCYGLKGGIGSASRLLTLNGRTYTIGVLVLANHGRTREMLIDGRHVGREIVGIDPAELDKGSIIQVLATDLPLSDRQLKRVLKRLSVGLIRTGSFLGHGSGDIMVGFSTANVFTPEDPDVRSVQVLREGAIEAAFNMAAECSEEAILNALCMADTVTGPTGKTKYALTPYLRKLYEKNM